MQLAILAFVAAFLLIASCGLLLFYRSAMLERLSSVVAGEEGRPGRLARLLKMRDKASVENILAPFQNVVRRSAAEVSVIQQRLIRAGYRKPSAVNTFYAAKLLVPIALVAAVLLTGVYHTFGFFAYVVAAGLGFLLPDFWLGNRISNRQLNIRLGLPEALDLMVICTEAGLGLDQAMVRVAQEVKRTQPAISEEFTLVHLEQKAGRARQEALKGLAERTAVDSMRALVGALIQADTFGTSIAKTLRVYSDTLRTQRRQQAEEQAAKTTVKLVFPLVFFVFPSLFVVVLGPSVITIMESFQKYFGGH